MDNNEPTVFIVDDEPSVCRMLAKQCTSAGFKVREFLSPQDLLNSLTPDCAGCIISDVRMPKIDGFDLLECLRVRNIELPIIFISAYADVPMARRAARNGAFDFLQKPFPGQELLDVIEKAIAYNQESRTKKADRDLCKTALESLTSSEAEVLDLLMQGLPNKVIAADLDISEKTVEYRRSRIMQKFNVDSLAILVQKVLRAQES